MPATTMSAIAMTLPVNEKDKWAYIHYRILLIHCHRTENELLEGFIKMMYDVRSHVDYVEWNW